MWATEAFFEFGGEPHFILPTTVGPTSQQQVGGASPMQTTPTYMYSGGAHQQQYSSMPPVPQASASPHIVGPGITPSYGYRQQQQQQIASPLPPSSSSSPSSFSAPALGRALLGPEVQQSGKHNGLCRYLARLLRFVCVCVCVCVCVWPGALAKVCVTVCVCVCGLARLLRFV